MKWGSREPEPLLLKQTRWRLLHWSNPKDGAIHMYLYVHTCARTFLLYMCIYNIYIICCTFMWDSSQERGVTLEVFPWIPEQMSSHLLWEGERWTEKGFVSSSWYARHALPLRMSRQPSPVIDSSVPLGRDTGICWPWNITCWVAPNRAPILPLPEIEGKRKKNPNHNASFCESPCLKSSEEAYNTRAPNAQTRIRCGLMADSAKRG